MAPRTRCRPLAALLPDKELSSWARIPLEAIPDPAADAALREAMGKVQGRLLIGVINSIGVRRDAQAVDSLAQRLGDADAEVASAAAVALGRIGNAAATKILEQALATAPEAVRGAVAEGCVYCAEQLLAADNRTAAASLYDKVRAAQVPKTRILEATRGAILAQGAEGIPLLVEQLESADKSLFALGLSTAREMTGENVTTALVARDAESGARAAGVVVARAGGPRRCVRAAGRVAGGQELARRQCGSRPCASFRGWATCRVSRLCWMSLPEMTPSWCKRPKNRCKASRATTSMRISRCV